MAAVVLAGCAENSKNFHLFDFTDWRQQTHWEAVSGSWLTQDGKYVLESRDGGETFLKPDSVGGLAFMRSPNPTQLISSFTS